MLLWEIVTYGKLPLSELETEEIIQKAEVKELYHPRCAHTNAHTHTHTRSCTHILHAHNRPENCPEDFYTVMSKCHKYSPKERITFEKIVEAFSKHNIDSIFEGSVQV